MDQLEKDIFHCDCNFSNKKLELSFQFSNNDEAQKARENLYNVKWPENGKYISLEYIEESEKASIIEKGDYFPPSTAPENAGQEESKEGVANGEGKDNGKGLY